MCGGGSSRHVPTSSTRKVATRGQGALEYVMEVPGKAGDTEHKFKSRAYKQARRVSEDQGASFDEAKEAARHARNLARDEWHRVMG